MRSPHSRNGSEMGTWLSGQMTVTISTSFCACMCMWYMCVFVCVFLRAQMWEHSCTHVYVGLKLMLSVFLNLSTSYFEARSLLASKAHYCVLSGYWCHLAHSTFKWFLGTRSLVSFSYCKHFIYGTISPLPYYYSFYHNVYYKLIYTFLVNTKIQHTLCIE